ncbi:T-protein [Burkholderia multivorans]|uniref:T-protein n=1 Tax=Burkholderia multivorans TaxID=87883 RepID=A0ABD7L7T8_9BURK|nr:prephenate dehydrogenase dimerization domain-containing protein [Burkholderia multivorans]MBU9435095.1 prephenate dehydrogenase/arogenate dehydrogenase family protein [Burkholderia multivorans]SAJ92929.1 T-protein [Burkholderia multivorans]SAJ98021.1 T-protein [Burkholderia multivorans]HEF5155341.1 prephenate dehydrogenase [Burkholderia multivorans]
MSRRYVVIGSAGSIGGLVARLLRADGQHVDCIDLRGGAAGDAGHWIEADILAPGAAAADVLQRADTVVCAISFELLADALPSLLAHIGPDCALIETLSIKAPLAALLERLGDALADREVAGINPMFSGDLDPRGRPAAAVVHRAEVAGPRANAFFDVLRRAGLAIVPMDPHAHDRSMAVLQTLVHGAVLAFGDVLSNASLDLDALLALASPPFRVMIALLARMTCNHPDVYWEIQTDNPYSRDTRQALAAALARLEHTCSSHDVASFRHTLALVDRRLVQPRPDAVTLSKRIFDLVGQPG